MPTAGRVRRCRNPGSIWSSQAGRKLLSRPQGGLDPIDVLDPAEDGESFGRFPERPAPHRFEVALLPAAPALAVNDAPHAFRLGLEELHLRRTAAGQEDEALQPEIRGRRGRGRLFVIGIGIDEPNVDPIVLGGHEEELIALGKTPRDDRRGERCEQVLLDGTLERTRPELGAEPHPQEEFESRLVPLHDPRPVSKARPLEHELELAFQKRSHLLPLERPEDHDPIDPVQQLGPKDAGKLALDTRWTELARARRLKPSGTPLSDRGADVRREDHDALAEVGGPALAVRQPAVVEELEEHIPEVAVRLFELVEEDHRERLRANRRDQASRPRPASSSRRAGAPCCPRSGTRSCRVARGGPASRRGTPRAPSRARSCPFPSGRRRERRRAAGSDRSASP